MVIVPKKPDSHANIIIIDIKEKTIELFEPHGKTSDCSTLDSFKGAYFIKNKWIKKIFSNYLPDYKYFSPNDYLPKYGLQQKIDEYTGFCIPWSILYVHYRILNPNIPVKKIVKRINNITLKFLLRYTSYIEEVIKNKI